jgi:hypothetical protein
MEMEVINRADVKNLINEIIEKISPCNTFA